MDARANWHKTFTRRLRAIHHYRPTGRVLDVGCGPGFFMEAAAQMGYDTWGIDPSTYIASVAQEKFGARVQEATIETADFASQSFDIMGAFDTFEHIYDPLKFLTAAHSLLKPGGLLAITTPDPTSRLARVSGRRWVSFKIPEHVFYWSPVTIRRALDRQFQVLEITRAGQYATLNFLLRRLLGAKMTASASVLVKLLGRVSVYADNGSLTVIAAKA
jgi:SAM-dependent methyltransferase